jgi:hypothetical protein
VYVIDGAIAFTLRPADVPGQSSLLTDVDWDSKTVTIDYDQVAAYVESQYRDKMSSVA